MPSSTLIKEILIDSHCFRLCLQEDQPIIEVGDKKFLHVWLLVQEFQQLTDSAYIQHFSQISNFLWKGVQFQCIESIEEFQKGYVEQVELERKCPGDIFPFRLTDFKIFDISVMHEPLLEAGNLLYFVYNTSNGLPYRVICPFPYTSNSTLVHYQILPIKEDDC